MKIFKSILFVGILAFAAGCSDEDLIKPQTGGDEDEPIVVGDPSDSTGTGG